MPITPISADMAIISALNDEPNDVAGMTSAELKAKFDEAGQTLKTYINGTLLPGLTAGNVAFTPCVEVPDADNAQDAIKNVQRQIVGIVLGQIPDGTVTAAKLSAELQTAIAAKAIVKRFTATVPASGWSNSAPYVCSVSIAEITALDAPHITRVLSHDSSDEDIITAWKLITDAVALSGCIAFYASQKPETDIPVQIEVVR